MTIVVDPKLNLPDMPVQPKIVPGDYLAIDVGDKKKLQFKVLTKRNDASERPAMDPAGYLFTDYDQKLIAYLAGQVVKDAYQSMVSEMMRPTSIDDIQDITGSGYYHVHKPIVDIDKETLPYVEAHFENEKNGIVLILGTVYFYTVVDGKWSDLSKLKGGDESGQASATK